MFKVLSEAKQFLLLRSVTKCYIIVTLPSWIPYISVQHCNKVRSNLTSTDTNIQDIKSYTNLWI